MSVDETTVRAQLAAMLTPLLPEGFVIIPNETTPGTITKPTVRLSQQSIRRDPSAPYGFRLIEFEALLIEPAIEPAYAEDQLDDEINALTWALDQLGGNVIWTNATKVIGDDHLGYQLSITVRTPKPNPESETSNP